MKKFNINSISIESKTSEHYNFLENGFGEMYIKEADFLVRNDLFVVCLRNDDNTLITISLCRLGHTKVTLTPIVRVMFILVDENYRGNKLNTLFNTYIQEYCLSVGCHKMVCNIKANNTPSIITFLKSGFIITNKVSSPYKDGTQKLFLTNKF